MGDQFFKLWEEDIKLLEIEKWAKDNHIPIISKEIANILKTLLIVKNPKLILEVGTAIGYSTLWFANYSSEQSEIVTLERDQNRLSKAKKNIEWFNFQDKVNFKYGDAFEIIPYLRREFDFIFIDAAKGQYLNLFKMAEKKLSKDGVIICDNVLYKGLVRNKKDVKHKMRTIVSNMQNFLIYLKDNKYFKTDLFNIGDGLTISSRRNL
ncbi:MAG: O-methyltransferase [Halanaerobiales bacterium]|nr:O-methyltransferase [Halanaerobiales bacterium]